MTRWRQSLCMKMLQGEEGQTISATLPDPGQKSYSGGGVARSHKAAAVGNCDSMYDRAAAKWCGVQGVCSANAEIVPSCFCIIPRMPLAIVLLPPVRPADSPG